MTFNECSEEPSVDWKCSFLTRNPFTWMKKLKTRFMKKLKENIHRTSTNHQRKSKTGHCSLDYRIKWANIAKAHPTWSLLFLPTNGCQSLKNLKRVKVSTFDKYSTIDLWTYKRLVEARENCQQVTTRNLQQNFEHKEIQTKKIWNSLTKSYKLVSQKLTAIIDEIFAAAECFRMQTWDVIPSVDEDFVIDTDQTGMWKMKNHVTANVDFENCLI